MNECRCGKPTRDGAYACDDCGDSLSRALGDIPWLAEELEVTISRQKGVDYRTVGGSSTPTAPKKEAGDRPDLGSHVQPDALNWGASEARADLKAVLVSWALFCAAEHVRNSDPRTTMLDQDDDNLVSLSRYLLWRVDGLTLHEIGPDAVDEITTAVTRCHRIIDARPDARFYGQCACEAWLYGKPGSAHVQCRECGVVHEADHLNADMWERAMDKLVTTAEARALANRMGFEMPESTMFRHVAKWVKDGRLIERTSGEERSRRFAFKDIAGLLESETRPKVS